MTIADQGTIYQPQTGYQNAPLIQNTPPSQSPRHGKRILIVVVVLLLAGLAAGYSFYGYVVQQRAEKIFAQASERVLALEQAGATSADAFYSRLSGKDRKVQDPTARAFLWDLFQTEDDLTQLNHEINVEYGKIIEEEKRELESRLTMLEADVAAVTAMEYQSKREVESFAITVRNAITMNELSLESINQYQNEIPVKRNMVASDVRSTLRQCQQTLLSKLGAAVNFDIAEREDMLTYADELGKNIDSYDAKQIVGESRTCNSYIQKIDGLVEQARRDSVLTTITAYLKEADSLTAFFKARSGYEQQITSLNGFKQKATSLLSVKSVEANSTELEQIMSSELHPTIDTVRAAKFSVEEQEKQEQIQEQKRLLAEANIPLPPVDAPKVIFIDIQKQRLYAYQDGISIFTEPVPITTGKAGFDTVRGNFAIYQKSRFTRLRSPFPNIFYDNVVDFWMPFYQGYGLHDASWRTVYGTMDYPGIGSHGCVNVPYTYISQLYQWAEIGTPVIVQ